MNESLARVSEVFSLLKPLPTNLEQVQRIGSPNDGGYVLINDFTSDDFLISMGVADDVNFEMSVAPLVAGSHLYDFSIDDLPRPIPNGQFFQERIGGTGCTTLQDVVSKVPNNLDLILKIDIEGSEWEAFDFSHGVDLKKFRQIVIEFHWLENILNEELFFRILRVLKKFNESHFVLNSHANNHGDTLSIENISLPSVLEVTYLRRNSYQIEEFNPLSQEKLAKLNKPCNPNEPELYFLDSLDFKNLLFGSNSIGFYSRFKYHSLTQERDSLTQERDVLQNSRLWRWSLPYRSLRSKHRK